MVSRIMWVIKFSDITNQMKPSKKQDYHQIIPYSRHNMKSISTGCSQGPLFTFGQQISSVSLPAQLFNQITASTSQPSSFKFNINQNNHHQTSIVSFFILWLTIINNFLFQGYITWCRLHDLNIKHVTQNSICLNHNSVSAILNARSKTLSQKARGNMVWVP